jgi:hypothetical protein
MIRPLTVSLTKAWRMLIQRGFPAHFSQAIKSLYASIKIRMYPGNLEGRYLIEITEGVLHGRSLSFVLFNVYVNTAVKTGKH